jgi:type IV pilus assembly protein PilO
MPSFSELNPKAQALTVIGLAVVLVVAIEYALFGSLRDDNTATQAQAQALEQKNAQLRPLQRQLPLIRQENASLQAQLVSLYTVLPPQQATDDFIRQMEGQAAAAGIQVRRVTAKASTNTDLYVQSPYDVQLDGSYGALMNFYDRLGRLPRIVSVSDISLTGLKSGPGAVNQYRYLPSETVTVDCTVTTYYSQPEATDVTTRAAGKAK